eukprot:Rmarinus@m.1796
MGQRSLLRTTLLPVVTAWNISLSSTSPLARNSQLLDRADIGVRRGDRSFVSCPRPTPQVWLRRGSESLGGGGKMPLLLFRLTHRPHVAETTVRESYQTRLCTVLHELTYPGNCRVMIATQPGATGKERHVGVRIPCRPTAPAK